MKEFFSITESNYQFSIFDVTALFTILNVAFIILGYWFAPLFGLVNCGIFLIINVKNKLELKEIYSRNAKDLIRKAEKCTGFNKAWIEDYKKYMKYKMENKKMKLLVVQYFLHL